MSESAEEDVLLGEHLYDVAASIHQIRRWPLVKRGYIDLSLYLCFIVLFVAIVLMQTEVTRGSGPPPLPPTSHVPVVTRSPPAATKCRTRCERQWSCSPVKSMP
jgi:hypothetical protein